MMDGCNFTFTSALSRFSPDTRGELLCFPVLWVVLINGKDVEARLSPACDYITPLLTHPAVPLCIDCSLQRSVSRCQSFVCFKAAYSSAALVYI